METPRRRRRQRRWSRAGLSAIVAATAGALVLGGLSPAHAVDDFGLGDPVLELKFEDSVADSSPLAHPTALKGHNGSTTVNHEYVAGTKAGTKGLKLNGSTFLDLGTSSELVPSDLTLSFWFKPTTAMGSGEQIITWNKRAYNTAGWYASSVSATNPLLFSFGPGGGQPHEVRAASTDRAAASGTTIAAVAVHGMAARATRRAATSSPAKSRADGREVAVGRRTDRASRASAATDDRRATGPIIAATAGRTARASPTTGARTGQRAARTADRAASRPSRASPARNAQPASIRIRPSPSSPPCATS